MTYTIQPRSLVFLNEKGEDLAINKSGTADNIRLLFSVIENLTKFSEALSRLDHALKTHEMELSIYRKYTEEERRTE